MALEFLSPKLLRFVPESLHHDEHWMEKIPENNLKYCFINSDYYLNIVREQPFFWRHMIDRIIYLLYTNRSLKTNEAKRLHDLLKFKDELNNYKELPLTKWILTIQFLNREELYSFGW